ncbi:glycosyltransferase [Niabella sp. CC-SYL272]|uniref:glycosyltransferase n=1 Tax=Niabella agricola TaxID=2891571 RepID=UPI001F31D6C1|nr:glycosyltransferase [Niabella agricola]MCF3112120.1 glycosyltransferase [Niabella agricola]
MRIIEIIHSLNLGGAERLLVDLSNRLALEKGVEVFVVVLKNREALNENLLVSELSERIHFVPMGFGDGPKLKYLIKVYKKIREIRPDIVHIHCQMHYLLWALSFYSECRYVYTLHSKPEAYLYGYRKFVVAYLARKRNLVLISISESNRIALRRFLKINNDILIYNGRSKPSRTSEYTRVAAFINEIKRTKDDMVLLSVARCTELKNLQLLIQSVNGLVRAGVCLQLVIVGNNYFDTSLGEELRKAAGEWVHFVGPKKNVGDYFLCCDAFCLSSLYEGMPITLLEAFACGCIPVSTPVSGAVDIIEDGKTGFLAADFSVEAYALVLKRMIQSREILKKENMVDFYEKNFSIEKCSREYLMVFNRLFRDGQ